MPTDSFRVNSFSPPMFIFFSYFVNDTERKRISSEALIFTQTNTFCSLVQKDLHSLTSLTIFFCACPVHAPFLGFKCLTISDAFRWPLSSTVVWIFPYLCHSWLTWYVPGCLALVFCFFIVTLCVLVCSGLSLTKLSLINKLLVHYKRNKHQDFSNQDKWRGC